MNPVTLKLAAELTGFSESALYTKIHKGQIPHYKPFGGKSVVIDLDELYEIMTQNRVATEEERDEKATAILLDMQKRRTRQIKKDCKNKILRIT